MWVGSGSAWASPLGDISAGGLGRFEAEWLSAASEQSAELDGIARYSDRVAVGMAIRLMGGFRHVQLAARFDLHLGGTAPAGFYYALHLRPIGLSLGGGDFFRFSTTIGVGVDGVAPLVPAAARFPLDALIEIPAGSHLRFDLATELAWLAGADARLGGAEGLDFVDETAAVLRVRIGDRFKRRPSEDAGNGYFFGVKLEQRLGVLFAGAVFGHGFDVTMRAR